MSKQTTKAQRRAARIALAAKPDHLKTVKCYRCKSQVPKLTSKTGHGCICYTCLECDCSDIFDCKPHTYCLCCSRMRIKCMSCGEIAPRVVH